MQISDDGVYLCLRLKYTAGRELTYAVKVAGYFRSVMTESIEQSELIAGKQDKDMIMETYRTFMEIMDLMVLIFVFAAVILGVVVLYILITALVSEYELSLTLGVLTYSVSILVTFGVSLIVGWMVARKNNHIDMVEALKGRE